MPNITARCTYPLFEATGHTHDELEFMLVSQGYCTYMIDSQHYRFESGDLFWVFPEQFHHLTNCSEDLVLWYAQFEQSRIHALCQQGADMALIRHPHHTTHCCRLQPDTALNLVILMQSISLKQSNSLSHLQGMDYLLLHSWQTYQQSKISIHSVNDLHPAVHKAIFLLHQNQAPANLNRLAQEVGISTSLLSRMFNQQIGINLSQYRNRLRTEKFIHLAKQTPSRNFLELALDSGFGSYAQFQRAFKSCMGISPAEWKKNKRDTAIVKNER